MSQKYEISTEALWFFTCIHFIKKYCASSLLRKNNIIPKGGYEKLRNYDKYWLKKQVNRTIG